MNENKANESSEDKSKYNNNYEKLLKLGLIDIKENNYLSAEEKFHRLIKLNNKKYEAHLNLSNIYILEGDILKANSILINYTDNIEENAEIINALAINFFNSNDLINLEIHLSKYINNYQSYILYYLKGSLLLRSDKVYKAENFFKKSMKLNTVWNNCSFLLNQYEKQSS